MRLYGQRTPPPWDLSNATNRPMHFETHGLGSYSPLAGGGRIEITTA